MTKRTTTSTTTAAGLLVLAGTLAGCSTAGQPSGGSTNAAGGTNTGGTGGYESCLREKGYDYPDQDTKEHLELRIPQGADAAQFQQDLQQCLRDSGDGAAGSAKPRSDAELDAWDAEVAACVRREGIADFPDDVDARAPILERNPAADAAVDKCSSEIAAEDQKEQGE